MVQGPRPGRRRGPSRGATETSGTGGDAVQVPRPKSCFPSLHPSPFSFKGISPYQVFFDGFLHQRKRIFLRHTHFFPSLARPSVHQCTGQDLFPGSQVGNFRPGPQGTGLWSRHLAALGTPVPVVRERTSRAARHDMGTEGWSSQLPGLPTSVRSGDGPSVVASLQGPDRRKGGPTAWRDPRSEGDISDSIGS